MGRLDDRTMNHPLRQQVAELRALVSQLDDDSIASVEEHSEGTLDRLPKALTYIEGALASADPALTTAASLDGINNALSNAITVAGQLGTNPEQAPTLDQYIEEALAAAAPIVASSPLLMERAGAATEAFNDALSATVVNLGARANDLNVELQKLEERRQQAASETDQADEARRQELTATLDALTARVDSEQQRLDGLVATFEQQFADAQEARQGEFATLRDVLKRTSDTTIEELKTEATETGKGLTDSAGEILKAVEARRADVEKLYGVITDTSTTGAFRDEAKAQKAAADTWRKLAVTFGVVAAALALGAIVWAGLDPDEASSVGAVIAKITATLAAAGIAAYAGRQSGSHREREEEAKRLELELAAFPPFIDSLDDDQRRAVRKEFADRAFKGRPGDPARRGLFQKDDSFGIGLPELMAAAVAAVRQADKPS